MPLTISPEKIISFKGPFDKSVHVNITLSNEHDPSSYAFKVKTTAPKRYLVRPIHGSVEPGEVFTVHVYLQGQPNTDDIVADLIASRDKFLIQSAPIGPEEKEIMSQNEAGYSQLWHHLERNKKQMIRENRMRCSFVFPPEDDDLGNGVGSTVSSGAAISTTSLATAAGGDYEGMPPHPPPPYDDAVGDRVLESGPRGADSKQSAKKEAVSSRYLDGSSTAAPVPSSAHTSFLGTDVDTTSTVTTGAQQAGGSSGGGILAGGGGSGGGGGGGGEKRSKLSGRKKTVNFVDSVGEERAVLVSNVAPSNAEQHSVSDINGTSEVTQPSEQPSNVEQQREEASRSMPASDTDKATLPAPAEPSQPEQSPVAPVTPAVANLVDVSPHEPAITSDPSVTARQLAFSKNVIQDLRNELEDLRSKLQIQNKLYHAANQNIVLLQRENDASARRASLIVTSRSTSNSGAELLFGKTIEWADGFSPSFVFLVVLIAIISGYITKSVFSLA